VDGEEKVGTFHTPHDAELAALHLRKRGIEARVDEAHVVVGMNPLWDPAIGGVRLLVKESDCPRAKRLLAKYQRRLAKRKDPELYSETYEGDATAARAFRAAVLGFFCAPVALHLYSLSLVLQTKSKPLSKAGQRNRKAALWVNWLTIAAAALLTVVMCSR
jgi:hypothetical protein